MTTNFKPSETKCKCGCEANEMEEPFMKLLQALRDDLDRPLHITSGYRCYDHNEAVGGAMTSYHKKGRAADIVCLTASFRYSLIGSAIKLGFGGIGIYRQFVHLDNREESCRKIWAGQ